jgi:ketosteroid isomerase-like protein
MKIRLAVVALVGVASSFVLPSLAQQNDPVNPQITEKLNANIKAYDEAVNNNDAAAVAALYTEDAVFVSDRGPIYGRKAIEKWYADVFQGWHPKNHAGKTGQGSPHAMGTAGNEIWSNGEWSETGQGGTGEAIQIKGYWSAIDIREGDSFKIRMMTYNLTPAPTK